MAEKKNTGSFEFGPNEARLFLRRHGLPLVPVKELTPKVCASILAVAQRITELGGELSELRRTLARVREDSLLKDHTVADLERHIFEQKRLIQEDALTGVSNRHGFNDEMARMIARRQSGEKLVTSDRRTKNPPFPNAVVVMFDLNHLKKINSDYGHDCGDAAIKHIAKILKNSLRKGDFVARTGGDEFVAIMYGTSEDAAEKTAQAISDEIIKSDFKYKGESIPLSVAFGAHQVTTEDTPESIMEVTSLEMLSRKESSKEYAHRHRNQAVAKLKEVLKGDNPTRQDKSKGTHRE